MLIKTESGSLLFELALVLAILGLLIPPLLSLGKAQSRLSRESSQKAERQTIEQSLEGFVLSHGRLPCPAQPGTLHESWNNGQCQIASGDLPAASLSLGALSSRWSMTVATLGAAGAPAEHALHNVNRWQGLSPQQLSEIILNPPTSGASGSASALPAIHLCNWQSGVALPDATQRGCGNLGLHSPTAVLVITPTGEQASSPLALANQGRSQQFLIDRQSPADNPLWMSYERLIQLWAQAGWLQHTGSPS